MSEIVPIPQLKDNYAYLVVDGARCSVVDAAEASVIDTELTRRALKLDAVLSTHHHFDHTGGNAELASRHPGLRVIGSAVDAPRIAAITERVASGEHVTIGSLDVEVLFIPCHTSGHVAYKIGADLFTGDTLFAGGCGRFFEGTPEEMYNALYRVLGVLPDDTRVWCGHEYTQKNLEFALGIEPDNALVARRLETVREARANGRFTVPSTIGEEKRTNPFMRAHDPAIAKITGLTDPIAVLGAVRALKDKA